MPTDSATSSSLRRFRINRLIDETGVSGTGIVAEGVLWPNGWVEMFWLNSQGKSLFPDVSAMMKIHGHDGKTVLEWVDG